MPEEPQNTQPQPEVDPQVNSVPFINESVQPNQQQVEPVVESNYVSPPPMSPLVIEPSSTPISTPEPVQVPVQAIEPVITSFIPVTEPSQVHPAFGPEPVIEDLSTQPQENIAVKTRWFKNKKVIIGVVVLAVFIVVVAAVLFLISAK